MQTDFTFSKKMPLNGCRRYLHQSATYRCLYATSVSGSPSSSWTEYQRLQSTDSSLINLSASWDGSYTLLDDEDENLGGLEGERSVQDRPSSLASTSSTLIVDDNDETLSDGRLGSEPSPELGM